MAGQQNDVLRDRWGEVDALFGQALDMGPAAANAFLLEACAGDDVLFDTVSRLLQSSELAAADLAGPGSDLLRAVFAADEAATRLPPLGPGASVGRYRLLQEIGRGGMATVYEAERADGAFNRRVAIKVLRGVDSDELARRFVAERQILSSLSHTNIASLIDGGSTEDDRPYLVMELVAGDPIDEWADRRRLGVTERLELFTQVLDAVQYAHAHLVVHRDIKPSNVLVDEEGKVRLLDFGIAKLLHDVPEEPALTRPATRWMTPEYAAPEQILAQPITVATDVHALGVLLYQLLTGHRPFGGDIRVGFELERAICEEAPREPSTAVRAVVEPRDRRRPALTPEGVSEARSTTPPRLVRSLSGDLDAILSKCLRKAPDDRYGSVEGLHDDVRRHLTGFPVTAREGLRAYRARKFVGRHRVGVVAAAILTIVLAGSATLLARLQAETAVQRDLATASAEQARTEAENAQLVIDFLADVFRGRDPTQAPSDTFTAKELLAWGSERVSAEFTSRPAVQAELLLVLGDAHYNLGQFDEGLQLMERAVELRRATFGPRSPEVADALEQLAALHRTNRSPLFAIPLYEEAISIRTENDGADGPALAAALGGLGLAQAMSRSFDEAEASLRRSVEIMRRHPEDEEYVASLLNLAFVLRNAGKLAEAEAYYDEGIPRYRLLPDRSEAELAAYLNNLGYLRRVRGEFAEAAELYGEALEIGARLYGRGHPTSLLWASNLASALDGLGRPDAVLAVLQESLAAAEQQWPTGHWRVASSRRAVGDALLRAGRVDDAEPYLLEAATYFERELGQLHDWTSFSYARLAVIRLARGNREPGMAFLDRLHGYLASSELNIGQLHELETFMFVLKGAGPETEYRRFRALHPDSLAVDAVRGSGSPS